MLVTQATNCRISSILQQNTMAKRQPASVPTTPMLAPVIRNTRMMAPWVAPMVRRMPISRPLSFTSMMRPEMILKAATMTMIDRMINIMLRSTWSTEKKPALRWRQSTKRNAGMPTSFIAATDFSTVSGSSTITSSTSTVVPLSKKRCASASGMKIMLRSNSDMPISKMAVTL